MNKHIDNVNGLLALEGEIDEIVANADHLDESENEPIVTHTMIAERYVGGETRYVCSCGSKSAPARIKVTSKRIMRHTKKTGHQWVPASEENEGPSLPKVSVQSKPEFEVIDLPEED